MAAHAEIKDKNTEAELNMAQARLKAAEAIAQELENEAVRMGLVSIEDL